MASGSMLWDLTLPRDELTSEQQILLDNAPYSSLEKVFFSIIIATCIVGIIANVIGFLTLIRNRTEWDHDFEQFILTGLAIADIIFLVVALIFYVVPFARSPVSQDVPFFHCWRVVGVLFVTQVVSSGLMIGIAAEIYWRATRGNTARGYAHKIAVVVLLPLFAILSVDHAVPAVFDEENIPTKLSVRWPNSAKYENFPQNISVCSILDISQFRLVIFHDLIVFWIAVPLIAFFHFKTIGAVSNKSGSAPVPRSMEMDTQIGTDEGHAEDSPTTEATSTRDLINQNEIPVPHARNLQLRVAVFFVCHIVCRLVNLGQSIKQRYKDEPLVTFLSMEYELLYFILRMLLVLQPAINPFIYFFGRSHLLSLAKKTFKLD